MHHIFFPPRLEIVVEKYQPNGFPADPWRQFSPHCFIGYQSHRPSSMALWWLATNHGDNALSLAFL
jgi:hypothetical protein